MNTTLNYHPTDAVLMDYSCGKLSSGLTAMTSAHLSLCGDCREKNSAYESTLADEWLADEKTETIEEFNLNWQEMAAQLSATPQGTATKPRLPPLSLPESKQCVSLPASIAHIAQQKLAWKKLPGGINQASIDLDTKSQCDLIYMEAGGQTPLHKHKGTEITLVLDGSFEDDLGSYGRGDFLVRDTSHTHSPLSKEGCLCIAVLDKPLKFTSGVARLLNPWNQIRFTLKHGRTA